MKSLQDQTQQEARVFIKMRISQSHPLVQCSDQSDLSDHLKVSLTLYQLLHVFFTLYQIPIAPAAHQSVSTRLWTIFSRASTTNKQEVSPSALHQHQQENLFLEIVTSENHPNLLINFLHTPIQYLLRGVTIILSLRSKINVTDFMWRQFHEEGYQSE